MTAICLMAVLAAPFHVQTIPLPASDAHVFLAHSGSDRVADTFVLGASFLRIYTTGSAGPARDLALPAGCSAVDVADLDGDGQNEAIAVNGRKILRIAIDPSEELDDAVVLFEAESLLETWNGVPFPHVLVVHTEEGRFIGLPRAGGYELRTPDGSVHETFPSGADDAARIGRGFTSWAHPSSTSEHDRLHMGVHFAPYLFPELPASIAPAGGDDRMERRSGHHQARSQTGDGTAYWGWFPLRVSQPGRERVLYAATDDGRDTWIRLEEPSDAPGGAGVVVGRKRKYNGALVIPRGDRPDFNGDGYADLLTWRAEQPAVSVNAFARALSDGTWPVRLFVHVYEAERKRYGGRAAGHVALRLPTDWLLDGRAAGPLRNLVLRDFNGDRRTDLALSTDERSFHLWRYEAGFTNEPQYTFTSDDDIEGILFQEDLAGNGKTTVGLKTGTTVFLLSIP